jgi:hypothetical protein
MTSIKNYNNFKVKCKLEIFDEIPESTHIQNLDQFDALDSLIRK